MNTKNFDAGSASLRSGVARLSGFKRLGAALLVALACLSGSYSWAGSDALQESAPITDRAVSSLLLDVVRAGERLVAVGERGFIVYSDDQGQSWKQSQVPVRTTLTAVYFATPSRGWSVGHDGVVLASLDGGETWVKQLDGHQANQISLNAAAKRLEELEAEISDSGEELSEEQELMLGNAQLLLDDSEAFNEDGATRPLLDLWFKNPSEGIVVGAYGLILRTSDGGETWHSLAPKMPNPDLFHYNAIAQAGSSLFIAGEAGSVFRSDDEGQDWQALESPYEGSYFGVLGSEQGREVLIMGLKGHLFSSHDRGESWAELETGTDHTLSSGSVSADNSVMLVGYSGTRLLRAPGQQAFTVLPVRIPFPYSAVSPAPDGGWILAGYGGVTRLEPSEGKRERSNVEVN
ncbi:TPA: hypothetical protein L4G24_001967 [Pseudomonas aeruginosa]|nr:hypothetical protein [Pseudomonas fluorescens]HBO1995413.1 hypothetical protein [Pseudomonas aeruginosa]